MPTVEAAGNQVWRARFPVWGVTTQYFLYPLQRILTSAGITLQKRFESHTYVDQTKDKMTSFCSLD